MRFDVMDFDAAIKEMVKHLRLQINLSYLD